MPKAQAVRLFDVFLLGPFMVWAAGRLEAPESARMFLWLAGMGTIAYNGYNYLKIERQRHAAIP